MNCMDHVAKMNNFILIYWSKKKNQVSMPDSKIRPKSLVFMHFFCCILVSPNDHHK